MDNETIGVENSEKKPIIYSIPDFFHYYNLNMNLINLMRKRPEMFRDNVVIGSVYGAFPGFIWNSGRATMGQATFENIVGTVKAFNDLGISVRYTCTNALLQGMHLMDLYCNKILEVTENELNGVTVNLDILDRHITKNFPKFYHVWSTTKGAKSVEETNKLSKDRLTVPYYGMNNTSALDEFEHPEHIEILVSEACIENCPLRSKHYEDISKLQLIEPSEGFMCPNGCENYLYYETVTKRKHYVSPEMIEEIYLPRGIHQFKIGGRNDNAINVIENYANYFARPEQKDNVRNVLLHAHFGNLTL